LDETTTSAAQAPLATNAASDAAIASFFNMIFPFTPFEPMSLAPVRAWARLRTHSLSAASPWPAHLRQRSSAHRGKIDARGPVNCSRGAIMSSVAAISAKMHFNFRRLARLFLFPQFLWRGSNPPVASGGQMSGDRLAPDETIDIAKRIWDIFFGEHPICSG
jgi:hypothetical protein